MSINDVSIFYNILTLPSSISPIFYKYLWVINLSIIFGPIPEKCWRHLWRTPITKYVFKYLADSVPTDRRSFRAGPKKIIEDRSVQDLRIAKRTSKDLFLDSGTTIRFFEMDSLEF